MGAELRWLLRRAFGPAAESVQGSSGLAFEPLRDRAQRFDLAARIGARTPQEALTAELGPEAAQWFRKQHSQAAARFLIAEAVCRELAEAGHRLKIPLIFLKGSALQLSGMAAVGSRNMGDIDVLVPGDGTGRLQAALVESGCTVLEAPESEHQLQHLSHRLGLGIEVHKIVLGVRLTGGSSAMADDLIDADHVQSAPGLGNGCFLPCDEVMLAHVLVHGIAQHGLSPEAYPMARMLADAQDLGVDGGRLAAFLDGGFAWIADDVSREEVEATTRLALRLGAGEDPADVAAAEDAVGRVLRHLVAGAIDEGYVHSLKFRGLTDRPRDMGRLRAAVRTLRGAVLLTKAQVDILYGPPRTGLGYWGWRLWRPFDLVARAVRYTSAWVANRRRR
jgi:hypothetical protein